MRLKVIFWVLAGFILGASIFTFKAQKEIELIKNDCMIESLLQKINSGVLADVYEK